MRKFGLIALIIGALSLTPAIAQVPISSLSSATTPLAGTELLPIVQSGSTKKITASGLLNLASPGPIGSTTPSTGAFTTLSTTGALTYGGVTLSNSVTGTGPMVLSASPTLTGTLTAAAISSTGETSSGAILSSSASGGIGYVTGAGGTVTQGTSRTTTVVCAKPVCQITLFSVAGSVTPASFTVTNSSVAANDVVACSQKSGTDLYEIFVTAVAAGSYRITSFTTGGTTSEQPVFNCAAIKGAAS